MNLIEKFAPVLRGVPAPRIRDPRLLIDENKADRIEVYYAPFEYVNRDARMVLVGITPGSTQMENANSEARIRLKGGALPVDVLKPAKEIGSFSGDLFRGNVVRQLNHWGVQHWLGIHDSAELFSSAASMLHPTSLIRYPTFVNGEGYAGTPDMLKQPLLKRHLYEHFVSEIPELPDALFFTLGPKVQRVLDTLARDRVISEEKILGGLLHGSPNNTYRVRLSGRSAQRTTPISHKSRAIR